MRGKMPPESKNPVSTFFIKLYSPIIRWVLKWKKTTIALNVLALAVAIPLFMSIGSEFMPPLDEGSLLYMPVTLPNVSLNEAKRLVQVQDKIIKSVPEVESVLGKVGRQRPPRTRPRSPCSRASSSSNRKRTGVRAFPKTTSWLSLTKSFRYRE